MTADEPEPENQKEGGEKIEDTECSRVNVYHLLVDTPFCYVS